MRKIEITQKAAQTFKDWKKFGATKEQIAAEIYRPLYKGEASKAETAQFLAEFLERSHFSPDRMRSLLPGYLVQAIDYVTGHGDPSEG